MLFTEDQFLLACQDGDLNQVKKIIYDHPDLDIHGLFEKPLSDAASAGNLNVVRYLIEEHQSVVHGGNEAILRQAAGNGHLEIVQYLVEEHQADINADFRALAWPAARGHLPTLRYLIQNGANYEPLLQDQPSTQEEYKICQAVALEIEQEKQANYSKQERLFQENIKALKKNVKGSSPLPTKRRHFHCPSH